MEKTLSLEMAEALSNAYGPSGFEDPVLEQLRRFGAPYGEFQEDSLRNLYLTRKGNDGKRPMVMLDAHSDEVGFMVQAIKPDGTLKFIPLGGWATANISAHKVRVQTADGDYIPGIVANKPPHYMTESDRKAPPSIENMCIDVGASSAQEAVRDFHIRIGAPVVPDVIFSYDERHDLMLGKSFDCRLGCAALIQALDLVKDEELKVDVTGTFSVQEEVGARGAQVAAGRVKPDLAIVLEGCPADDTVSEAYAVQTAVHKGPMLRHVDARMITNPRFQRFALDLAAHLNIPVQEGVRTGGSTNGAPIHLSNQGVPVIVIGIPARYIHTHHGFAAQEDMMNAAELAAALLRNLDGDIIRSF